MRLFVGIDFAEEVKNKIYQLVAKLQKEYPEIKWEKEENLHLTLKFLGNIKLKTKSEKVKATAKNSTPNQNKFGPGLPRTVPLSGTGTGAKLQKIIEAMGKSVAGVEPFEMRIESLGYFLGGSLIVWLGMIEKTGGLERLVKELDREMGKLGFKREKRVFHPHLTLGRKKRAAPVGKWRKIGEDITIKPTFAYASAGRRYCDIGDFKVRRITLFESKLSREGSTYKVVAKVDL